MFRVFNGVIIEYCIVFGIVVFMFDDGFFSYIGYVLDFLDVYGVKVMFFVNGENWFYGIDDFLIMWFSILKCMVVFGY